MNAPSRQEEDLLTLAALAQLGEATRHEVADSLGVPSLFRTLTRLEANCRVSSREQWNSIKRRHERIYRIIPAGGANGAHVV